MKYRVFAGSCWETIDMNIRSHGCNQTEIPQEKLVKGYNLLEDSSDDHVARVISFKNNTLCFSFMGETVTLQPGHIWHSPMRGVHNPQVEQSLGFIIGIKGEADPQKEEAHVNRLLELIDAMRANADEEGAPVWKNIPLAKEMLDILYNKLPMKKSQFLDATGIVVCCDSIFLEDFLDTRDVPRLCLEFLQLRKLAEEARTAEDDKYDKERFLGVIEADKIQNKLDFYINPSITTDWWIEYTHAHLKFDPVERTPQWEENIYEVEKEVDRRMADEPRHYMGYCHAYWPVKRAVLATHGIQWRSPSQMNPRVMFD